MSTTALTIAVGVIAGLYLAALGVTCAICWVAIERGRSKYHPHRCGNCPCSLDELLDEIMRDVDPDLLPTKD